MFNLGDHNPPRSAEELAALVTSSLRSYVKLPRGAKPISVKGKYPNLTSFDIDLSGCAVELSESPAAGKPMGQTLEGPSAESFTVIGKPIRYEQAAVDLELTAKDVQFDFDRDESGDLLLMLADASKGRVQIEIGLDDLERVILAAANAAAASRGGGISVKDVRLDIQAKSKRSVAVDVNVTAKKFVTATIHISGELSIDDQLNARFSKLACRGEGMVGSLVSGLVQPQLDKLAGRRFALMSR
jgi:hypothetical protein